MPPGMLVYQYKEIKKTVIAYNEGIHPSPLGLVINYDDF